MKNPIQNDGFPFHFHFRSGFAPGPGTALGLRPYRPHRHLGGRPFTVLDHRFKAVDMAMVNVVDFTGISWIFMNHREFLDIIKNIYIYIKMAQQVGISPGFYQGQWWLIIKNWNMCFWGKLFAGPVTGRCSIIIYLIGGIPTPWKYESQIGSSSQLLGKIKAIFQTTNQILQSTYWLLNGAHAKRTDQPMGHSRTSKEIRYLPL